MNEITKQENNKEKSAKPRAFFLKKKKSIKWTNFYQDNQEKKREDTNY